MVRHLRKLDYEHPLAEIRVFAVGRNLYFREDGTHRAAARPEQIIATFVIPFEPILHSLEAAIKNLDSARQVGVVETRRGTLGSKPVIAGTRIRVDAVRRLSAAGLTVAQIREYYPDLRSADIRGALADKAHTPSPGRQRAS